MAKKKQPPPAKPDPMAVTPLQAAELLSKEGNVQITEAMIADDVRAGAPTNPDGSINVVVYCSWLLAKEK